MDGSCGTRVRGRSLWWAGVWLAALAALAVWQAAPARAAVPSGPGPVSIGGPAPAAGPPSRFAVAEALRCARPAQPAGFSRSRAVTATAVGMAESTCRPDAQGRNAATPGCPDGSTDRGLWQINSCYHPEVPDECAYDPDCSARATYRLSAQGSDWSPWTVYGSGAYRRYLPAARAAVDQVYGTPSAA